jgi:hypothetical protein
MHPLCPRCLNEMSKAAISSKLFRCAPCREIIQFFDVGMDGDTMRYVKLSRGATHSGKNMRAA